MPPIDPHQLLKALSSLLTQNGAIKGPTESTRICSLMRDVTKLASKCVYINILRTTETPDVLEKFIDVGGWDILNVWLEDSKNTENTPILVELLKVYQQLPITVDLLKKNGAAKTIKQLRKSEDEMLKSLSSEIVEKWMNKIRENSNNKEAVESNEKIRKKKKSEKSEKSDKSDKSDKKDNEKDKQKEKDKHKHVSSSSHHHHHHHSKEKGENSIHKEEKSDSVSVDNLSTNTATGTVTPGNGLKIHIKLKRNDDSVKPPEQKRPSTVKRPNVKPRSSGVIEDSGPVVAPKKKVLTQTASDSKPAIKRPGPDQKIKEEPPWKKSRLHLTTPVPSSSPTDKSPTIVSPGDIHNQIKFPFQKPIKSEMHEDNSFINDIIRPIGRIKRKPRPGVNGTTPTKTIPGIPTTPPSPVSPTTALKSTLPSVPSFYKETLETSETNAVNGTSPTEIRSPSPTEKMDTTETKENADSNMETDDKESNTETETENKENTENAVDDFGASLQSTETTTKKKKKRLKVSWAEESKLHQYHYFEMDETERENVNKPKENFDDLKKHEMMMDRRVAESAKRFTNDNMQEAIPWRMPFLISGLPPPPTERGSQSVEKDVQKEREGVVLQALFFNKEMLPDGPSEPDVESVEPSDPKFIPLEDETSGGEEFIYNYDNPGQKAVPEGQAPFQLPPDVANMLANFHQQAANAQTPMDPNNPVLANVQNLLTSISGETKDPSKAEAALEQLKTVLNNPSVMPETLGMGISGGMSMSGMPPRLGLLGNAPPGFPMGMGGPPGAPRFPPPGPGMGGPHLGPGDHDDWGENMVGGPRPGMRGRGRPGIPMRGGRMPGPPPGGPEFGPMGPEFCGTDVPPPGYMGPRGGPRGRGMRGGPGRMRGGRPDLPVCRHYAAGGCRRGATCMFLHPGPPV
ncbi:serine/threonine-protein phosphatase 1 regulatory subunit 10-like [Pecten maximus]|uniref:serine/threonine-protein phosphatase 1 regulatory subunit 10-like n=1 Tax=Pecten maximus TaxID=6579 RepID=UPI0014585BF4|nr:serine/threonine-protein phosphatase 1 regulatory subunit 10-like [Pecten maximus]